jgi:hypothetical protein
MGLHQAQRRRSVIRVSHDFVRGARDSQVQLVIRRTKERRADPHFPPTADWGWHPRCGLANGVAHRLSTRRLFRWHRFLVIGQSPNAPGEISFERALLPILEISFTDGIKNGNEHRCVHQLCDNDADDRKLAKLGIAVGYSEYENRRVDDGAE